jgi:hypothetical protein
MPRIWGASRCRYIVFARQLDLRSEAFVEHSIVEDQVRLRVWL